MRQAVNALLAAPTMVAVSLGALLRRSGAARYAAALGLALVIGLGVIGTGRPAVTAALLPVPIVPLTQAEFTTTVETGHDLGQPVTIRFTTPMDVGSVAAALAVEPATPVELTWDRAGMAVTVSPRTRWLAGTFTTVTVEAGALARSGQPLAKPARAIFLTRGATSASIAATQPVGDRVAPSTQFVVAFSRPVDAATVMTAIRLDPPTPGIVRVSRPANEPELFTFEPTAPLGSDVAYKLVVAGVRDADGLMLSPVSLAVRTQQVPSIVRFRPVAGTKTVGRGADLSVRFSQAMDRTSAARAFTVTVAGKTVAGTVHWSEHDTVLVFTPKRALPASSTIAMRVGVGATSTAGVALAAPAQATFRTGRGAATVGTPVPHGGPAITGGSTGGGGSWAAVERYYLGLMNCTRTGGLVTSSGTCSSPGGRNVAPLKLDSGISSHVSRPYAKRLAVGADCSHFIGGNPGDRLRRAGFTSYRWAENIGCRSGNARAAVLASHLFFQAEKSTNGGHYVNLMNAAYNRVGIGVWVSGGRVRLVIDFYHS